MLGNILYKHIPARFIDTKAIYTRPNSTIHDDTGQGLQQRKRSTQNRLITTDRPVSYWLWYKTHHIHWVSESTSLITYIRNIMSVISSLAWNLKHLVATAYSYQAFTSAISYRTQSTSDCDIYGQRESHIATPTEASMAKYSINNFNCIYILFYDKKYF